MSELVLANAEISDVRMSNARTQPLITWFHFLNIVTCAVLCLLLLKIYKNFLLLYEWFRPVKNVSKCPNILVLGPRNNNIIDEVVNCLSRTFQSEVIECSDVNENSLRVLKPKTKLKKSRIILSHIAINSKEVVTEFKTYVEKTFGVVDILVVAQNEPLKNKSTGAFLDHLNRQLLSQFWAVMVFLPGMLRRNRGHILSVALEKSSLANTGIMRSIHEELLQIDTKVKLTLVESNVIFDNLYLPSLSAEVLARLIVWSMWTSSSPVKVPSISSYAIMIPAEAIKYVTRSMFNAVNFASADFYARR